ncbi:hypothetical protein AQZ52_04550 [Novosphingobium fuchskuhlense]|uniref:HPP family protein n=1 Tax=Novosphingobium fuchskuhlense TaxID=1117702 RepID=A0A117UX82_9SPHN|nr:hypothetical protein [Novosphingobium fuchskuhlense]KUR72519.1 hypothetical protein AQZ52_04550 [Novosphingobium fuchskuhlense]
MSTPAGAAAPKQLPLGQAAIITLGVVIVIAGFVALGAWLHVTPLYAGFLLLWAWSALHELSLRALPGALIGALSGAGMSFLLQTGAATGNAPLVVLALALMVGAVFLVVAGRAALVCNQSTMLFITVLNAPVIQAGEDFRQVIIAIMLGAVWFAAIAWVISRFVPAPEAPATA